MLAFMFAILGGFAAGVLVLIAIVVAISDLDEPPCEDMATPYREGLLAAARLQQAALEAEQQLYAAMAQGIEAERRAGGRS
jgi:hypothetical protein